MQIDSRRVAIITGANRGLGREIARCLHALGMTVALAGRDHDGLAAVAEAFAGEHEARGSGDVASDTERAFPIVFDVRDRGGIQPAMDAVVDRCGRIDVLVNNAGIQIDAAANIATVTPEVIDSTLETNLLGPMLLSQSVLPIMRRQRYGRIVNMSSSLGALHEIGDPASPYAEVGSPAYRLSKGALNLLTALLASETRGENILVNSVCPGWVRTDMGTDRAPLSVEEGADTPVWLATLPDDGPTGGFFRERTRLDW